MPLYEFYCADCRRESEVLVRSSHWEGTPCPHCGSTRLRKKLSVFAAAGTTIDAPARGADRPAAAAARPGSTG